MYRWFILFVLVLLQKEAASAAEPWKRHTIDASSRGADGVRVGDVNGDGRPDFTTGWEEGGVVRVYIHPGRTDVKETWPTVTVGQVRSPEDAVFADLNHDGALDVVSSCEGKTRTVHVHWAPAERDRYLDPQAWRTEPIPVTQGQHLWMYALPLDVDGRPFTDLIVGSKSGTLGWLQSASNPRELDRWTYHPLYEAGWTMSLEPRDMNRDGRVDILVSDRNGKNRGVLWLENPGPQSVSSRWTEHRISADLGEVMFLDTGDLDANGTLDIVVSVKPRTIAQLLQDGNQTSTARWRSRVIEYSDRFGTAKAVRVTDVDLDGRLDLVGTCEQATGELSGVFWLRARAQAQDWESIDIGGPQGVKFDRIECLDLDEDGDLDLVTCEEQDNLGVIWYENPTR